MGFRFDATTNPIAIPSNDEVLPNQWPTVLRILLRHVIVHDSVVERRVVVVEKNPTIVNFSFSFKDISWYFFLQLHAFINFIPHKDRFLLFFSFTTTCRCKFYFYQKHCVLNNLFFYEYWVACFCLDKHNNKIKYLQQFYWTADDKVSSEQNIYMDIRKITSWKIKYLPEEKRCQSHVGKLITAEKKTTTTRWHCWFFSYLTLITLAGVRL